MNAQTCFLTYGYDLAAPTYGLWKLPLLGATIVRNLSPLFRYLSNIAENNSLIESPRGKIILCSIAPSSSGCVSPFPSFAWTSP